MLEMLDPSMLAVLALTIVAIIEFIREKRSVEVISMSIFRRCWCLGRFSRNMMSLVTTAWGRMPF